MTASDPKDAPQDTAQDTAQDSAQDILRETIYARASGPGSGGIAVIRLSGPRCQAVLTSLAGKLPTPRQAHLGDLRDTETAEILDRGLILWFPGPASYSGEDMAELHLHGGRAVIDGVLAVLHRQPGLRLAEAGEFTRRAFQNGKMDLTAAEAVADLIAAETAAQRRQALGQMAGALAELYENWRARLIALSAHVEAEIDFAEEDLPADLRAVAGEKIAALKAEITEHLDDGGRGERLRQGVEVVILGAPNAGKSSLLNLLAKREVAIVSDQAGTTRDLLEVHLDLGGYPLTLVDTAGLRAAENAVEAEGVRRAEKRAETADFRLFLLDASGSNLSKAEAAELERWQGADSLVLASKADLTAGPAGRALDAVPHLAVSMQSGQGIDDLLERLQAEVTARFDAVAQVSLTRARHRQALEASAEALDRAGSLQQGGADIELMAEDLRLAAVELGRITGRVDVEDLLDVVFRDFCIGK